MDEKDGGSSDDGDSDGDSDGDDRDDGDDWAQDAGEKNEALSGASHILPSLHTSPGNLEPQALITFSNQ